MPSSPPGMRPTPGPACGPRGSRSPSGSTSSRWPRAPCPGPPSTTSPPSSGSAARENLVLVGPAGTGKSHLLVALGLAAVEAGSRVRYLTATDLVETLYRGLADNSVGRVIEGLLRHDLVIVDELGFAPLDDVGTQLLFRFVAAAYERRSRWGSPPTGRSRSGAGSCPSTPPRCRCWTGCSITPWSSSPRARASGCARPGHGEVVTGRSPETPRGVGTSRGHGWGLSHGH